MRSLPVYFGFDGFAGVVFRSDEDIRTSNFVDRYELAPRVTVPLHFGRWLGVTTSAVFRTTRYGDSFDSAGQVSPVAMSRNTEGCYRGYVTSGGKITVLFYEK